MARSRSVGIGLAAVLTAVAVAGGVAFGVGQLTGNDGPPETTAVEAAPTTAEPVVRTPPARTPTPTETATPTPTPTSSALYQLGDSSDGVRELQARLKQIQWYEPKITGDFDDVTFRRWRGSRPSAVSR